MKKKDVSADHRAIGLEAAHASLRDWYDRNGRHDLPWRLTRDPYAVFVSEVMLQQTQVSRVLPHYVRWLDRWPDVHALASASPADVIGEWAGLGYNRRALNLWQAARAVDEAGGCIPKDVAGLLSLPGVGPYSAAAVACFAYGAAVPVVDTNIGRVVARALLGEGTATGLPRGVVSRAAESFLPADDVRGHNLALMDLGALVCSARSPGCAVCPLRQCCAWTGSGQPEPTRPVPRRPAPKFEQTSRFARGRLVDALRAQPRMTAAALALQLPVAHRPQLFAHLDSLHRDGLIEPVDGGWALPGAHGRMSIASPKL